MEENSKSPSPKGRIIAIVAGAVAICFLVPLVAQSWQSDAAGGNLSGLMITASAVDGSAVLDLAGELLEESAAASKERVLATAAAYAQETAAKEKAAAEAAAAANASRGTGITSTAAYSAAPNGSFQAKAYENFSSRTGSVSAKRGTNSDVKGWIYVPGTNIDYPVLQDPNNDLSYYLHRNIYRNQDMNGVIWTGPSTSFSSLNQFTTIYGHNWNNCYWPLRVRASYDTMFEQLAGYHYLSTAQSYPYFYFSTGSQDYTVVIFAAFYCRPSRFYYWGNNGGQSVVNEARNRSLHDFPVSVDASSDRIITLSTCTRMYGYGADQKFVVMGRVLRAGESIQALNVTANTDHWNP